MSYIYIYIYTYIYDISSLRVKMSQNFCATHTQLVFFFFSFYHWNFKQHESTVADKLTSWQVMCRQEPDETFLVHTWSIQSLHFLYFTSLYILYHILTFFFLSNYFCIVFFLVVSFIILCLLRHCICPIYSISYPDKAVYIMSFLEVFNK